MEAKEKAKEQMKNTMYFQTEDSETCEPLYDLLNDDKRT